MVCADMNKAPHTENAHSQLSVCVCVCLYPNVSVHLKAFDEEEPLLFLPKCNTGEEEEEGKKEEEEEMLHVTAAPPQKKAVLLLTKQNNMLIPTICGIN